MDFKIYFLIGAVVVEVYSIVTDYKNEKPTKLSRLILISLKSIVAIGLSLYVISEYQSDIRQKKIDAKFGMFGKQKDATIKEPLVALGSNASQGASTGVLKLGRGPVNPLNVFPKNNQLHLDIKINDSRGDGVAVLSGRTWKIVNPDGIDYNNDDYGF